MKRAVICRWTEDGKEQWDSVATDLEVKESGDLCNDMMESREMGDSDFRFVSITMEKYNQMIEEENN